ncbi:MAG TPA: hypothetical protein VMU63_04590 [Acidimicrobiales bacterium]|nr:hypothetical protein [Acidimicrobiales bacterium]
MDGGTDGERDPARDGGRGSAAAGEKVRLSPALSLVLAVVVGAFLAATAYVSHLPLMHKNLAVDLAEGIVVGGGVGVVAATRGLTLRERAQRPDRRPPRRPR